MLDEVVRGRRRLAGLTTMTSRSEHGWDVEIAIRHEGDDWIEVYLVAGESYEGAWAEGERIAGSLGWDSSEVIGVSVSADPPPTE